MQRTRSIPAFVLLLALGLLVVSCSSSRTNKLQSSIDSTVFKTDSSESVLPFHWQKSGGSSLKGFITKVECEGHACKEGGHLIFKSTRIYGEASEIDNVNALQVPILVSFWKDPDSKERYYLQARKSCGEDYQISREAYIDFNSDVTPQAARQFDNLQANLDKLSDALCE